MHKNAFAKATNKDWKRKKFIIEIQNRKETAQETNLDYGIKKSGIEILTFPNGFRRNKQGNKMKMVKK